MSGFQVRLSEEKLGTSGYVLNAPMSTFPAEIVRLGSI